MTPSQQPDPYAELRSLLSKIKQLDQPQEMLARAALCRQALAITDVEDQPILWASLHSNLANSLVKDPTGNLSTNIEEALHHYQQAFQIITRDDYPENWATLQIGLGALYADRIQGNRIENIEKALHHFKLAEDICTETSSPDEWATLQNQFGSAFFQHPKGLRSNNIEQAIKHFKAALQVHTRTAFLGEWAMAMGNLATAYSERIEGSEAENLETAIAIFEEVLEAFQREANPNEWASLHSNLGTVMVKRIKGLRVQNIEQAIQHYNLAQDVYIRETFPSDWAMTHVNLGIAHRNRIKGERTENLQIALHHYESALEVYTQETNPERWATIHMNIASVYADMSGGNPEENLEKSIHCSEQALLVFAPNTYRDNWAALMNNLATSYLERSKGDEAQNLEYAIQYCQQAWSIYTRENYPEFWAMVASNLADGFSDRIHGDREENLDRAIGLYSQAMEVYTRDDYPLDWAMTQNNLAGAYAFREKGGREKNICSAQNHYDLSLSVLTKEYFPAHFRDTQRNRGHMFFDARQWKHAIEAYLAAIEVGDNLLHIAYSETGRRVEVGETYILYVNAAYCHLQLNQLEQALLYLERGKTRLLAESLALAEVDLAQLSEKQQEALINARQKAKEYESRVRQRSEVSNRENERDLVDKLRKARQELQEVINKIRLSAPGFLPDDLSFDEILQLVPAGWALVIPLITSAGSALFVVPHGTEALTNDQIIRLDDFTSDNLNLILNGTDKEDGWMSAYQALLDNGAIQNWLAAIDDCGVHLWQSIGAPLHDLLQKLSIEQFILIPGAGLQLLPVHIAWRDINGNKRYLIDDYLITYAPSAHALSICQRRTQDRKGKSALIVGIDEYSRFPSLGNACLEATSVAKFFDTQPLLNIYATEDAVVEQAVGKSYLHFSCHGLFAWGEDPLSSALILAEDNLFMLWEIINRLDLSAARLVTLAACATAITPIHRTPDEFIGLPAGFIQAGAPAVVGSLWQVDDIGTQLLMQYFYQQQLMNEKPVSVALREAQLWLRDYGNDGRFSHPFYWAAFIFYGA